MASPQLQIGKKKIRIGVKKSSVRVSKKCDGANQKDREKNKKKRDESGSIGLSKHRPCASKTIRGERKRELAGGKRGFRKDARKHCERGRVKRSWRHWKRRDWSIADERLLKTGKRGRSNSLAKILGNTEGKMPRKAFPLIVTLRGAVAKKHFAPQPGCRKVERSK